MSSPLGAVDDPLPFDDSELSQTLDQRMRSRWIGWRLRLLVSAAVLGCLVLFAVTRTLVEIPALPAQWQPDPLGRAALQASSASELQPYLGQALERLSAGGIAVDVDAALLFGSPRWTVDDADRERLVERRQRLDALFAAGPVTLHFSSAPPVRMSLQRRGLAGLGPPFWFLSGPALLLYLVGAIVLLARVRMRNLMFAIMALCQALSLLAIGVEGIRGLAPVAVPLIDDMPLRLGLDLATAAAALHLFTLHPVRLRAHRTIAAVGWALAAGAAALAAYGGVPGQWWWGQTMLLGFGLASLAVLTHAYRIEPHPFAVVMRRFVIAVLCTLAAVSAAVAAAKWQPALAYDVGTSAVLVWTLFFASMLVWVPFLSRSRQHLLREFALLAGLSTVATSLDLLFVSLFAMEPFASLTLAVFIALGVYAGVRQWVFSQMTGSALLTTERTFEQLYRVARELQKHPERQLALVSQLLRDLFEPLELLPVRRADARTRLLSDGSAMIVPLPLLPDGGDVGAGPGSLVLRFAQRGRRLFTLEDARLTERVVEQIRSAVAYDSAVELGRTEERQRIAQDLHDDIGARLLTLMYKAQDPEMEEYLRYTLQDLKTLTRGLAASEHRLSHSAAEWKADLHQRLTAAQVHLDWSFELDDEPVLTVVQWSALTRVLRELVSNTIAHAQATHVTIHARLAQGSFTLRVADDGRGRDPAAWTHGLGLGGVRKRVKLLGGEVHWRENEPHGIVCDLFIPRLIAQT